MNDGLGTTTTETGTSSSLIDSDHVQGTSVFDTGGKNIGTIKRLVIDKVSGRVAYTVAQFGGFLGLGGEEYTIPWSTLTYDTSLGGFRTNVTEDQLRGAPAFDRSGDDYPGRNRERVFNDYYGSSYYWE
jgi:sporulation protein YlmC with PRC-barrel domain